MVEVRDIRFMHRKSRYVLVTRATVCPSHYNPMRHRLAQGNVAYVSAAIPPSTVPLDSSLRSNQYCRIPGCRNKAYYNYAEQEQTEYCGHGHEL